jgi:hypothetical protein
MKDVDFPILFADTLGREVVCIHLQCIRTRMVQAVRLHGAFITVETPLDIVTGLGSALRCTSSSTEDITEDQTALLQGMLGLPLWRLLFEHLKVKRAVASTALSCIWLLAHENAIAFFYVFHED